MTLGAAEHGQSLIMDQNQSQHKRVSQRRPIIKGQNAANNSNVNSNNKSGARSSTASSAESEQSPLLNASSVPSMLDLYNLQERPIDTTIRFQVVLWHVGQVDMVQGRVPATFRVTIFWNAAPEETNLDNATTTNDGDSLSHGGSSSRATPQAWKMHGRQRAFQQTEATELQNTIEVPAVSLLNVETFTTVGEPEVVALNEETRLMRWTCMYRATLFQDQWEVDNFPHDEHDITLRLAILAQRESGAQWDRHVWKLDLARESDSMGSVRVPYGLVVDHVKIPEFQYNKSKGLQFEFGPLDHGPEGACRRSKDKCLSVKLKVWRNSSYYDRNIMPLLGMLNAVAISITALEAHNFFQRALLTLNIAFVEIGMRMTADSKLPTASYQIKMQRILNEYFFGLCFLVLESLLVYELNEYGFRYTGYIDWAAALGVLLHNLLTQRAYHRDAHGIKMALGDTSTSQATASKYW